MDACDGVRGHDGFGGLGGFGWGGKFVKRWILVVFSQQVVKEARDQQPLGGVRSRYVGYGQVGFGEQGVGSRWSWDFVAKIRRGVGCFGLRQCR
ncbi:hypothetical protein [Mycolicibacterium sarraceniae]|uniref:Uncharacterized protein n=1 Tax=Mycolicibacterium sarraceniae TaxID=1534348 RepID=A0A7I7SL00_9MYCO|nr:hypothetical protein [Mycolicibacterium sarraceniae]BBY57071.1 hypothetical protein MSAR_02070 [Mycolicibacterium sarraceniae]BBY59393.1 hypothetical protein MSAR_25290 [Mycolicibacterium sarraceniae]